MIEITFPKSEIETYNETSGLLNIFVEGGGMQRPDDPFTLPQTYDEFLMNARELERSYAFTAGIQTYGDESMGIYYVYWCPLTPLWSRNYNKLLL